ncbi:putative methyltransferase-domain-containing protein [Mycena floridula]|nr:putative methyltransferase-domain-containing protein [Mycena floridula]
MSDDEHQDDACSELISNIPGLRYQTDNEGIITLAFSSQGSETCILKLSADVRPGNGGRPWPAGQVLARFLVSRGPNSLAGKHVVELGSGTGLVGLVAAQLGAKQVSITDRSPLLPIMEQNIAMNHLSSSVHATELNWGETIPDAIPEKIDLIVAADCVYFEPAFPLLVQTLSDLVQDNTEVLFCYKKRRKADKRFFTLLKRKFNWTHVMDDPDREIYARESVSLFRLSKL